MEKFQIQRLGKKKKKKQLEIAKKKVTRRGKYIQKEKSIHGKKNKKPLKNRNKAPAFLAATSNKEDSTCQPKFLPSVNHHTGKITGCWK